MATPDISILANGDETYVLLGVIEETKYSSILYARTAEDEEVAIKVIHKQKAYARPHGRESVAVEQRIMRQATELGRPFLAQLLSSWDDADNVYLVMRLYYSSLLHHIRSVPLTSGELELCVAELVSGLCSLHAANIMHRDINAANILVAPSGHVALADFGLTFTRPSDDIPYVPHEDVEHLKEEPEPNWILQSGVLVGTSGYMAPEVVTLTPESTYSKEADVWSLGMTILEVALQMTTPYFFADRRDELTRLMMTYDAPLEWVEDPDLRDLLSKMLKRSPFQRWTAEQLKQHRYFDGMDWSLVERGGYYPIIEPETPAFEVYQSGVCSESADLASEEDNAAAADESAARRECILSQMRLDEVDEEKTFVYRCPEYLVALQDHLHEKSDSPASSDEDTLEDDEELSEIDEEHGEETETRCGDADALYEIREVDGEGTDDDTVQGMDEKVAEKTSTEANKDDSEAADVFGAEEEQRSILEAGTITHVDATPQRPHTTRSITLFSLMSEVKNAEEGSGLQALRSVSRAALSHGSGCLTDGVLSRPASM
ncbi:hypothetical protein NM688_g7297 [Phlebia brevispora]|uniref:Uncharacterized protein n=1 Tax=Phlebia brevispora TaxID=194682 RepID=A0ACC1S702_9APHY|nr:hypothetical protein NM688_g7297 [Phlebia brevispora]